MVPQRPTRGNDPLPHSLVVGRASAAAATAIAPALQRLLAHDVADWPLHGLQLVKQRTVRTVLRGVLDGVAVHVKVFRADTLVDHVRDLVRTDRGRREAANLLRARTLGLPVVEPLAHGFAVDGDRRHAFVVTATRDGEPFTFATASASAARAVGALLRRLHDAGERPGDLHPGNVVVGADGEVSLLDLTSVRHGGEPSLSERARALAFFCHELDGGALDPAAREVLSGYGAAGAMPAAFRSELRLATHRWRAAALPAFGRRAFRDCRHTELGPRRRGLPRWCWHRPEVDDAVRAACEAFAASPPPPAKSGRRGAVWQHGELVVKQRDAAKAKRLWRASYWLLFARVPAAAPVAVRTFAGSGLVFTKRLANASLADDLGRGALDARAITAAARSLGDGVGRLHAHGLRNRDLKLDNLVRDPAAGAVHMVDLDGVRPNAALDTRGLGADLGRLLAAFRAAGAPGGAATVRTFVRAWLRAQRRLLRRPPLRRLLRHTERRAREWASAHASR
jgi:tRNA A-37 threonylcarbamoyl transferase component Bud32